MASRPGQQRGAGIQQSLGLPPGTKFFSPYPFAGMNLQASPTAIADSEFLWVENFLRLGDGNMRTAWDVGTALYTSQSADILMHFPYTIGLDYYVAVFLIDGSAYQVSKATGAVVQIGPASTFYSSTTGYYPACTQWGTLYLLISNRNTSNDYWVWDGALLYGAGTSAPSPSGATLISGGSGYTSLPTVTPFGGHGTDLVVVPTVNAGNVVDLQITNPGTGYEVGDVVQLQFSGGGSDTGPILEAHLSAGSVAAVNVTAAGTGYSSATVAFSGGGGTGAAGTVILGSGVGSVTVGSGGSGYSFANISFTGGGGTGAAGTATISNGVSAVTVLTPGTGYTTATVSFSGGGGTGAAATANIVGTAVTSITVTSHGTGYTAPPTVTITGDGTGATATAAIQTGTITAIAVTTPGTGYTSAPTVVIDGDGSGAMATAVVSHDNILGVTITNGGTGYTSAPTVTFGGAGSGATGVAILNPASIESVTVVDPGSGFTFAPSINFVGGGGAGATGVLTLTGTSIAKVNIVSPGQDYQDPPTITFTDGGGGSGATAVATIDQGQVIAITVVDGGFGYTANVGVVIQPVKKTIDKVDTYPGTGAGAQAIFAPTSIAGVTISNYGHGYTDAPAIEVQPGGNNAAYATVALMPFGLSGSAMETYQQRVWLVDPAPPQFGFPHPTGGNFTVTAPGSFIDVATSDGGVLFTNTDRFLQTRYTGVRQSNGYLYLFGDGSVSIVSSVNTTGDPATTTFSYQNVDPQIGLSFRDSMQDFSKTILFANETGIYGIYGGSATLASTKLQDLFNDAIFPTTTGALRPSSAIATLFDVKHYMMLMTVLDPDTGAYRNVMTTWNEKEFTITTQSVALNYISTQKVSSKFTAWGSNGRSLYPLFARPSASLVKRLGTKIYGGGPNNLIIKNPYYFWMQAQDKSVGSVGINCSIELEISGMALQPDDPELQNIPSGIVSNVLNLEPVFSAPPPFWPVFGTGIAGAPFFAVGARLSTSSPDFVMSNISIAYQDIQALL